MLTVTKLTKGKGNFYQATFSNGESLKVSEDLLVRYRLLKGQELSAETLAELKQEAGYDLGLQQAMNYLSYQIHTEKEVYTYLKDKEFTAADSRKIIARLKELALIDDRAYGESYVRTQIRLSDKGPIFLQQQLKKKGLAAEDIQQALTLYGEEEQFLLAVKVAQQAVKRAGNKSFRERQQKMQQQLMQKGFSREIIQRVKDELVVEPDVEEEYSALVYQAEQLWRRHQRLEPAKRRLKIKQSLYQKGFSLDEVDKYLTEKEEFDEG